MHLVKEWLNDERNGEWMAVVDNLDDLSTLQQSDAKPTGDADGQSTTM